MHIFRVSDQSLPRFDYQLGSISTLPSGLVSRFISKPMRITEPNYQPLCVENKSTLPLSPRSLLGEESQTQENVSSQTAYVFPY